MDETQTTRISGIDHDLIVRLTEKVENLTREVRTSNDGNKERIAALELRTSRIEDDHLAIGGVKEAFNQLKKNTEWIENEKRNRIAYRILYVGVTAIISFIVGLISLRTGLLNVK